MLQLRGDFRYIVKIHSTPDKMMMIMDKEIEMAMIMMSMTVPTTATDSAENKDDDL